MLAVKKFLIYYQSNPHRRGELRSPKMPMSASELKNLDKNIARFKAQLANKRDTLVTIAPEEKVRLRQQIEDLREQIRDLEQEQWQLIGQMTGDLAITNEEAEPIVAELVTEVESVKQQPDQFSPEILGLLQQILAKLNAPNTPAAAKLKAAISTLPPFVSLTYEAELDTESTFRTYFPTFNRYLKEVKERLKKLFLTIYPIVVSRNLWDEPRF
jgi:polyhydroxyalkanoate synthesis regulator phasin